ncbi:cytochrome P450 6B6-like [Zerene cesonia]|uniref:cytochrome P450 6B6-like n=1 Tax=Zerene cesonia TaxID=33412 RepID=UPI0018E50998|nr:cytochrome P450 6B6-like [Zerene cesonia]
MIFVTLICVALIALYFYGTKTFKYWEERGVKHDRPIPILGNNARNYLMFKSMTQVITEVYWKYPDEPVVGFFRSLRPELIVRDPNIIKRILNTDFQYFYRRGINHKSDMEPLNRNLFFTGGDMWRLLRQRLTPAFSSAKLHAMFPLIEERAERLQARVLALAAKGQTLDARDLMARYTTDFIGACGFGLDADSLQDENSEFRKLGMKIFSIDAKFIFKLFLKQTFPETFKNLKIFGHIEKTVIQLMKQVLKQRNYQPSSRNDFVDLLIECKKKGTIVGESIERRDSEGKPEIAKLEIDDEILAAQMFVFFAAGFETSSSATSTTLNELAHNPHVQVKVQEEIDRVLAKHNNKLCYEAVKEMTYLEWTFKEGMRVLPSLGFLLRECVRKYTFEDLNFSIDEGVLVIIPVQALQNDPKYFPDPEEFRPERFDPELADPNNKFVYLPFGEGPRACVGERLGLMQSLAGLAAVLSKFDVSPAPGAPRHPVINPASGIVQSVVGGIPLVFRERSARH